MAVGLYTQYYPNSHFFAMHKTYGTLCKNQEEQDGAICKKIRTWLSTLGGYLLSYVDKVGAIGVE